MAGKRLLGKQASLQLAGKCGVLATDPFKEHGGMLFFFIPVVLEDAPEFRVSAGVAADSFSSDS